MRKKIRCVEKSWIFFEQNKADKTRPQSQASRTNTKLTLGDSKTPRN